MSLSVEKISEDRWTEIEVFFESRFGKVPDLQAMLFLIGINEYGHLPQRKKYTKEQKQDLIHVAVCSLLEPYDYYMREGYDEQGWPHFLALKPMDAKTLEDQEELLKTAISNYISNQ